MKKRLKNLLALCMVAMMMFAMSTGVVSAETYYAHMPAGGVNQYIADKNHGNDSRTLYKGIPDNVTIAMNPGDVIVPLELTGADGSKQSTANGKYDDFCGQSFFIVKSVDKSILNNTTSGYGKTVYEALSSEYKEKVSLSKVYQYDESWDAYKTICKLVADEKNKVKIKDMEGQPKDVIIQEWQNPSDDEKELMKDELAKFKFYESAYYDEFGYIQWQNDTSKTVSKTDLDERNNGETANGFTTTNIETEPGEDSEKICSALELPDCGYGYHYNVRKISANTWNSYTPTLYVYEDEAAKNANIKTDIATGDNIPTGIKPLKGESEVDYNDLIDTIFAYKQKVGDTSKYFYESQLSIGLEITEAANTYTINFNAGNGGEGDMGLENVAGNRNTTGKLTYSAGYQLPENKFTKTGYTFNKWIITEATYPDPIDASLNPIKVDVDPDTIKAPYQAEYADEAEYTPGNHNETVTMTAQWTPNTYTVKFDANGGEGEVDAQSFTYDDKKQSLNENKFIRNGYTFTGWNTKADGTGTSYSDKAEVQNLTEKANDEVILYAQWKAKDGYKVEYDTDGGTPSVDTKTNVKWTDKVLENIKEIFKTGYKFKGWQDNNGKAVLEDITYGQLAVKDTVESITLTAQWEANDYTVKYDTDGGSDIADKTVKWADKVLAEVADPTKEGFTFKGWKCGETEVTADTTYSALAEDDTVESITLTAQWEANDYTVKYDTDGGSDIADKTVKWGDKVLVEVADPTKEGFTFKGWKCGETEVTADTTYSALAEDDTVESITLTAQWEANDYTVKYDTDGGSDIADKTVKWGDKVLVEVADPTKEGFTFKGWKCGKTEVTADTTYSALAENDTVEALTLKAQWEEVVVPADEPTTPDDTSSTGDNMNITLLMALLLLSGCGIAGAGLYRRNHVK